MLYDVKARVSISVFNHARVSAYAAWCVFRQLICKMSDSSDKDKAEPFDKDFADEEDLFAVSEWFLMSLVACTAGDDVVLHSKLRHSIAAIIPSKAGSIGTVMTDVLQVVALMKVLFPVKFATFSTDKDLMEINISDNFTFATCYSDKVATIMQPVILTVTIVSMNHF